MKFICRVCKCKVHVFKNLSIVIWIYMYVKKQQYNSYSLSVNLKVIRPVVLYTCKRCCFGVCFLCSLFCFGVFFWGGGCLITHTVVQRQHWRQGLHNFDVYSGAVNRAHLLWDRFYFHPREALPHIRQVMATYKGIVTLHRDVVHCCIGGGYIATHLLHLLLSKYANCRNTGTLPGDLAGTNFVLFLTKFEPYIIWKEFSNCSYDKYLFEIQIYAYNI